MAYASNLTDGDCPGKDAIASPARTGCIEPAYAKRGSFTLWTLRDALLTFGSFWCSGVALPG